MKVSELSSELRCVAAKTNHRKGSDSKEPRLWLPFWMHALDTEGIMIHLVQDWLPASVKETLFPDCGDRLLPLCRFLALVHDLGKMTSLFAARIFPFLPETLQKGQSLLWGGNAPSRFLDAGLSPHPIASAAILCKCGCDRPDLAAIISAHHGAPQALTTDLRDQFDVYPANYFGPDVNVGCVEQREAMIRGIWKQWYQFALSRSGCTTCDDLPVVSVPTQMLLTGLLIVADWISSDTDNFPLLNGAQDGQESDCPQRVSDAWHRLALPSPWRPRHGDLDSSAFKNEFGFLPNAVQRSMIETASQADAPGICILEAQMGIGKTEAALAAAEVMALKFGCGGLCFGLPTQATSNGIFPRLESWGETQSQESAQAIRLAHGMSQLNKDYRALFRPAPNVAVEDSQDTGVFVHQWFEGRKQALLANIVIGTVDQLLMAALKQRHVMLRHLGLAGKVVIIDECHAYDAYMNQYLEMVLRWLGTYRTPVILLSATLPEQRRAALIEAYLGQAAPAGGDWQTTRRYPLLTWTDGSRVRQEKIEIDSPVKIVALKKITDEELAGFLGSSLRGGGCAGVIVNTVVRAQRLAAELRAALPGMKILVAHSRFTMSDRADRDTRLLSLIGRGSTSAGRDRLIVVGTQVLEQSLDIDFDLLVTDLCPMDLLLQRMGRLHRHKRDGRPAPLRDPVCALLSAGDGPPDPGSRSVYGSWLLLRTRMLLPKTVSLPLDIPSLVQETYAAPDPALLEEEPLREAWEEHTKKLAQKEQKAKQFRIRAPGASKRARRNTINGLLDTAAVDDDIHAQAAVRDTEPSLSVIVLVRGADGTIRFLPWQYQGACIPADMPPCEEECLRLLRQRVTLPRAVCAGRNIAAVSSELATAVPSAWKEPELLRRESFLFLDEEHRARVGSFILSYGQDDGLSYQKEES